LLFTLHTGRNALLKSIAFLSGAALMSLEIVGSRVLAPYFGTSVFVWGSLIGVVLAALSVGAYLGGRIADRIPGHRPLATCLGVAGVMAIIIPWIGPVVNREVFALALGPRGGPLAASLVLFVVPGLTLGAINPFVLKLSVSSVERIGETAGLVSALSTAGSIFGTLVTAFYLIPVAGVSVICHLTGAVLVALGGLAWMGKSMSAERGGKRVH
jgi:MFS family permease